MSEAWHCVWCGNDRWKAPTREQLTVTTKIWKPLCSACLRKRERLAHKPPFYGGLLPETRPLTVEGE